MAGQMLGGDEAHMTVADKEASIKLPSGELRIELDGELSARLDPPNSGGLLVSLAMWRRLLILGPENFGEVYYWGTAPIDGRAGQMDVLAADHGDIECRFYFDPANGELALVEMTPEINTDPCEIYLGDYREIDGRAFPGRMEVRHGEDYRQVFDIKQFTFMPAGAQPEETK
jgi:hypothetical protein